MKYLRFVSVPVFSVLWLMGFIYYITVHVFIEDWVGLQSSPGTLNTYIFTFFAVLSLFSFFACIFIDPGHVSSSYVPDVEEDGGSDRETRNNKMQMKHCDKCSKYKPPRAHHCRACKRCVLRMDHHCIWINNCVGYWNYKAFFIFIVYATLSSIYSTSMIVICTLRKNWDSDVRAPLKIFYVSCGVMMVALNLTLGSLLGWHIYLMTHNMTTIEYYEGKRAAWLARKSGQSYRHPFNLSIYKNITSVLGPNMLSWLLPTAVSHLQDGTHFPTIRSS